MTQKIDRICIYLEVDGETTLVVGITDELRDDILKLIYEKCGSVKVTKISDAKFEKLSDIMDNNDKLTDKIY